MELLEVVGYIAGLLIGVSLGLIGGGGSVLAVPVLAYLFSLDEKISTAYSLFVVGVGALVGGIQLAKKGNVDFRTAIVFGIPSLIGVYAIRYFVVPIIPDKLFSVNGFEFSRRMLFLGLFAILMIPAALSMMRPSKKIDAESSKFARVSYNYSLIMVEGLVVGAITGLVGAGGGFLIIPALVVLAKLDMKKAIGTSLFIIAIKSILGFSADVIKTDIDWEFLLLFTGITIIGIFIGTFLNSKIDGAKLKVGFGYFIIAMAIFIFSKEFLLI